MKKVYSLLICAILFLCYSINPIQAQDRNNEDEVVKLGQFSRYSSMPGEVLVKFKDETSVKIQTNSKKAFKTSNLNTFNSVLSNYSISEIEQLLPNFKMPKQARRAKAYNGEDVVEKDLSKIFLIKITESQEKNAYSLIDELKQIDEVEFAEPNFIIYSLGNPTENDINNDLKRIQTKTGNDTSVVYTQEPMYSMQWGIPAVKLDSLWRKPNASSSSARKIIAILDTGVDILHPDLAPNIWTNTGENNQATGYDDDNNGFIDDIHGWDFVNQTADMHDFNSHGTHCAGIAAACGTNGIGITGANPNALIMPVAVMQSNGQGSISTIIQGINYAAQNGADIISMSIGTYANSIALEQALAQAYQTTILVAAAGNDYYEINFLRRQMFPAAYTFVLGVQATSQGNGLADFSNYDEDGPSFSQFSEEQLYNYELSAPGVGIISTIPGGQYRSYNGTSMSCPLVAGGISLLLDKKPYQTQEMLWGDLINYSSQFNPVNFLSVYNAGPAPAQLSTVAIEINDTTYGDSDYRADAGERINMYPTIRTTWGATNNIRLWLSFGEFEDTNTVHILNNNVDFGWSLSSYAKAKSINPIQIRIDSNVVDGRNIRLVLNSISPNTQDTMRHLFTIQVENGVELRGVITQNKTLYPNVHYIVTDNLAIAPNVLLTIKPGTTLKFKEGASLSSSGRIYAVGKPDSIITFTKTDLGDGWGNILFNGDTLSYCKFENLGGNNQGFIKGNAVFINSEFKNNDGFNFSFFYGAFYKSNFFNNKHSPMSYGNNDIHCDINVINVENWPGWILPNSSFVNIFNNKDINNSENSIILYSSSFGICILNNYYYLGSNKESVIRNHVFDFETPNSGTFAWLDLSNRAERPFAEAHGIVWKVEVDGFDAQDDFDSISPLGVGRHEFKVYFNRAMDTSITPMVAMGVRPPYTQNVIREGGFWSADSTIYTSYFTLRGSSATDGLNRIYVANAKDNEHFEIPFENKRFNVMVQAAGSMSLGFQATAGIGKIDLEWNNQEMLVEDFLGFNMYRYKMDTSGHIYDSIQINTNLIQDTVFTDFNVVPGQRYYYFYKILRTDLSENSPSKIVSTIPLTATRGDANGSFSVDVADIVSTIAFVTNQNPQPFIFDAADVNGDGIIDILDIVGIINIIMNPDNHSKSNETHSAVYTIEDGVLYVDSPVDMGGVQFKFSTTPNNEIVPLESLAEFEKVSTWLNETEYMFMAYSMSGKKIPAGKTALLRIGNAEISEIVLSDIQGNNILPIKGNDGIGLGDIPTTKAQFIGAYPNPFKNDIAIKYALGNDKSKNIELVFRDIMGRQVDRVKLNNNGIGKYNYRWEPSSTINSGVYFVSLMIDGIMAQTTKIVLNR
ncbi:MAG: T9SS type A sorting domain-containing protein [Bacteroidia bacterium]|nr:T9SS type A sorting domain-containing protein [Bacteroidia bacterium]